VTAHKAYLIEVDDTKDGVCHPTVIGPFDDCDSAAEYAEMLELGTASQSGQGGYSDCHVICDCLCDYSPEQYLDRLTNAVFDRQSS